MSKDIVKNYGKSIRSKLLNIAKNEDVLSDCSNPILSGKAGIQNLSNWIPPEFLSQRRGFDVCTRRICGSANSGH